MVDLVHSRNSKFLKIEGLFSLTKSIFGSVLNRRMREDNSLRIYTLFICFREVFFLHLWDGEFTKVMREEE